MTDTSTFVALLEALADRSDADRFGPPVSPELVPGEVVAALEAGPTLVRVLGPVRGPRNTSEAFALVHVEGEPAPRWIAACRLPGVRANGRAADVAGSEAA